MSLAKFLDRGGLWVMAQIPVMLMALILPVLHGAGGMLPRHPLSLVGVLLVLLSVWLAVWGAISLGKALTPYPEPLPAARLRRQGAYRWMRHPLYAAVMLGSLGWALWWLSIAGVIYAVALAAFFDRKAAHEETRLRMKFPDYAGYARRVKKFIPGVY